MSNTSPTSANEATTSSPTFFDKLPLEVRDMIYEFAFRTELEESKVVWRTDWQTRELKRRSDAKLRRSYSPSPQSSLSYEIKPFPGSPIHNMMVSKQFYCEATTEWMRTARLSFSETDDFTTFLYTCDQELISKITTVHVEYDGDRFCNPNRFLPGLTLCSGLKNLRVTIVNGLQLWDNKIDFIDELRDSDFVDLQLVKDITTTRSIRCVEIVPGKHELAEGPTEIDRFRSNLKNLNEYVMRKLRESQDLIEKAGEDHKDEEPLGSVPAQAVVPTPRTPPTSFGCGTIRDQHFDAISDTINDLGNIFNQLGHLVAEQQQNIDNLEVQTYAPTELRPSLIDRLRQIQRPSGREIFLVGLAIYSTVCSTVALYIATRA